MQMVGMQMPMDAAAAGPDSPAYGTAQQYTAQDGYVVEEEEIEEEV